MLGPPTGAPMVIRRSLRPRPECRFIVNIHSKTFLQDRFLTTEKLQFMSNKNIHFQEQGGKGEHWEMSGTGAE